MTGGLAVALVVIAFGLSAQARRAQERWSRIVQVESETVATLEELIRAQNSFRREVGVGDPRAVEKYRSVRQLLDRPVLRGGDTERLRERVESFERRLDATDVRLKRASIATIARELDAASVRVVNEARRLIDFRKREIERQLPQLERDTRSMMITGLAVAWIVILLSFAAAKVTISRVVRPLEEISDAAQRIARGHTDAEVPITGDYEVAALGTALKKMANELRDRARTDELTALPNFRAFRERIDEEIARSNRYGFDFGVLVLDLDRFKKYNDRFGHLAGNDALQRVSRVIKEALRRVDFPARYGGEEFAVVLPQTDNKTVGLIAERIRASVEALPAAPNCDTITVSIGGAIYPADGADVETLFQVADERLYRAKKDGRNRVVVLNSPRAAKSAG